MRKVLLAGCAAIALLYAASANAQNRGVWSETIALPNIPISIAVTPNNKLVTWAADDLYTFVGDVGTDATPTSTSTYNIASGAITSATDTGLMAAMFCSGIAVLPDGRVMTNGGSSSSHTGLYDPATNKWANDRPMNVARGYNGDVVLSTGNVFTIGGSWSGDGSAKDGELWTPEGGWQRTGISVKTILASDPVDRALGYIVYGDNHPWLYTMPAGRVFHAGPSPQMNFFDPAQGTSTPAGNRGDDAYSINGVAVMYAPGLIFKAGGAPTYTGISDVIPNAVKATTSTYLIDITADYANPTAAPVVTKLTPIHFPRSFANGVVLPDGKVLIVGGQSQPQIFFDDDAVTTPELWDPATRTTTDMADQPTPRTYHSTALLLPDGRVLSGGGGQCGEGCPTNHFDFELFSPPYLFDVTGQPAVRPVINTAPTGIAYGQTVPVTVTGNVVSFAMIRMSATTHTVNNDQRRIPMPIISGGGSSFVLGYPADPGTTVPGYYMIFALDAKGVPSVAKIILVEQPI